MHALIDGDILRYEIGFAAEAGYKQKLIEQGVQIGDNLIFAPGFDYVENILHERIQHILDETGSDDYDLYLTEGETFREGIAVTKPYKGNRVDHKPWHYKNLSVYMKDVLNAQVVKHIEADDAMAIIHSQNPNGTIICSRDKDLRQVPGRGYSWELGRQASFGPEEIDELGWLNLDTEKRKLSGVGYMFFASQVLTGDTVDNIPGLRGCGPVAAYNMLKDCSSPEECEDVIKGAYKDDELLKEQATLCWIVRRLNPDHTPETWKEGLYV